MEKKVEVYLWDNDPIQQHYNVGTYKVKGYVIPYELYLDLLNESEKHDVYFLVSSVIDAFVDCVIFGGSGQAVSVDCSMFLNIEVINGN